ncbi:MAG: hypothetical protein QMC80_05055 [Thermoplasmatales archaeon]|nr:hypothetical protein [Thermoplasmatales archaeon]
MRSIGVLTENFSVYYDLVRVLKEKNIVFESLSFDKKIPARIGVVITTKEEGKRFKFKPKVFVSKNIEETVQEALKVLSGKDVYHNLIIGVDPGERPGVAVVGDNEIIHTEQADTPEDVKIVIEHVFKNYSSEKKRIRIGNGAKIFRDRTINAVTDFNVPVEIVDESGTTKRMEDDIEAAIEIAFTSGKEIKISPEIRPTHGDLKRIQDESRIMSGSITISEELAEKVAKGEMCLKEAIRRQKRKR